jgi:hypothetical protein
MSYQLVMASVEKVKTELTLMSKGILSEIFIDTNHPRRLAYLIMQGMAAAEHLELPVLCELKLNWKIKEERGRIKCEKIVPIISEAYLEFAEVKDLLDLLDVWTKHKDLGIELHFPSIHKNDEIMEWLANKKHEWRDGILVMREVIV